MAVDPKLYRKVVSKIPLFRGLSPDELGEILKISKLVRVKRGTPVVKEGEDGAEMFMVVEGHLRVDKGIPGSERTHRVAAIKAPSVFGEMSLIDGCPRSATVTTTTDAVLFRVDLESFNRLRSAYHPAVFKILRQLAFTLCDRLNSKIDLVVEFHKNPQKNMARLEKMFLSKNLS